MKNYLFILSVLVVSCNPKVDSDIEEKGTSNIESLQASLDSLFNAEVEKDEPGAALLVAYQGEIIVGKGYGLRDVENKLPITPSTNMRMGSVSKQFTALTVLQLIDEGKLSLSDSVYSIFPFETFKDVTVEQLINHTSGRADAENALFTEWDTTKIAENKDVLDWYAKVDHAVTKPGEQYQYNNGIYEFIACLVEEVSGQDFAQFAKENIFDKAGMGKTNFFNLAKPIDIEERAFCYERDSLGNWNKVDGHYLNGLLGAGGLYTSVNDYFQYDSALRNNALFKKETHELIFRPSSPYPIEEAGNFYSKGAELYYAMGWGVTDSTAVHSGGWFGTNTFTKRYLNKPLTYAIFMNRNTMSTSLVQKTDSLINLFLIR